MSGVVEQFARALCEAQSKRDTRKAIDRLCRQVGYRQSTDPQMVAMAIRKAAQDVQ